MGEMRTIAGTDDEVLVTRYAGPMGAFRVEISTTGPYAQLDTRGATELRDLLTELLDARRTKEDDTRLTVGQIERAREAVPAPLKHAWEFDPAASGDRLRLFRDGSIGGGEVGAAYAGGRWYISDPGPLGPICAANGKEPNLIDAMARVIRVAPEVGWSFASSLGELAFDAYTKARGGRNHDGTQTPAWADLGDGVRAGWEAAAAAVHFAASKKTSDD